MPAMITRLAPISENVRAENTFRLLIIPLGFSSSVERKAAALAAWERIKGIAPFTLLAGSAQDLFSLYYWSDEPPELDLQQTGLRLSIPMARANALGDALASAPIADARPTPMSGSDLWPAGGRFGRDGSLVSLLVKGGTIGELYELAPSENYPTPVVGAALAGEHWSNLLVRGIAQAYAGLVDEFERPEPEFLKATDDIFSTLSPNVVVVSQEMRDQFAAGDTSSLGGLARWPINKQGFIGFFPHQGSEADVTKQPARRMVGLVEGGGGFRFNAFRSDFDCLMRRTPYSTNLPVQDRSSFCKVCHFFIRTGLRGGPSTNTGSVEIDRQRLLFDRLAWKERPFPQVSTPSRPQSLGVAGFGITDSKPHWKFDVTCDAVNGLKVSNLKLLGRDFFLDPFFNATEIVRSITFRDLSVTYRLLGPGTAQLERPLPYAEAFANKQGVSLRTYRNGSDGAQAGVKASFSWTLPGVMVVEAEACLVVREARADADPGGAGLACKYFPQLSMRYLRLPNGPRQLQVESLKGTVVIDACNAIPNDLVLPSISAAEDPRDFRHHLEEMRTGNVVAGLFTDSNTSSDDSVYKAGSVFPRMTWQSGRKLAAVTTNAGGEARQVYLGGKVPMLPHWSWLFDYATSKVAQKRSQPFVAAYHRPFPDKLDVTRDGKSNGGVERSQTVAWPVGADQAAPSKAFKMTIKKVPRQGSYDNLHVAADHGLGDIGNPNSQLTPAPFCADMCNHFHWRWGTAATSVAYEPYSFLGWGVGKVGHGANRVMGAPLVPPNQHVEFDTDPAIPGKVSITYTVDAVRPGHGERQVFLEQGLFFVFSYFGRLTWGQLSLLSLAVGFGPSPFSAFFFNIRNRANDLLRRELFDFVYRRIKFFDPTDDDVVRPFVFQTPVETNVADGLLAAPAALENL